MLSEKAKGNNMEKFFNSKFMKWLETFGQKVSTNKFMSAIQGGMMSMMAPIMVGSIFSIICAVGCNVLHLFEADSTLYKIIYSPYDMTMNVISVWVVLLVGNNYAKNLKLKNPVMTAINCLCVFFTTVSKYDSAAATLDASYLDSKGMFIGFLVVWVTCQIEKYCVEKDIRIKMPEVCPPSLTASFNAILPLLFALLVCYGAEVLVSLLTGGAFSLASGFMALLSYPLGALISVPGMLVLAVLAGLMWSFGIHGTMVLVSVLMAPMIMSATERATMYAQGIKLNYDNAFNASMLFGSIAACGGTGNTLPLCLMGLRSKSEQIKAVSKLGAVPGWFGINEPVTFGMPIMYNPVLCVPYILTLPINMILTWLAYRVGFLKIPFIMMMALLPMGFGGFLSSLSVTNFLWDYLLMIPDGLIYYPFFKAYEKQLVEEEQAAANA